MSIILSHRTARAYHRAPDRPDGPPAIPPRRRPFKTGTHDPVLAQDARVKLARYGVPASELEELHVLVSSAGRRRRPAGVVCHVLTGSIAAGSLLDLGGGVLVADVRLTALQAARDLTFRELVEYYYELCGSYDLPFDDDDDYRERPALTNAAELARYFEAESRHPGSALARRAVRYVRDGSRSPLETAQVMMLVLPKSEGGLGIRGIEMDHALKVPERARHLTRRSCFFCDVYIPAAHLDIEYHGFFHDDEARAAEDDERVNALRAMGCKVIVLRRWSFFNADAFRRFSAAVCREAGIPLSRFPADFDRRREGLRCFVLRRWL